MKGVELHTYALSWSGAIRLLLETADLYRQEADEAIEQLQQPAFECLRDRFLAQMDYCEWHDRDKLAADRIACQSAKTGWLPSGVAAEPTETRSGLERLEAQSVLFRPRPTRQRSLQAHWLAPASKHRTVQSQSPLTRALATKISCFCPLKLTCIPPPGF